CASKKYRYFSAAFSYCRTAVANSCATTDPPDEALPPFVLKRVESLAAGLLEVARLMNVFQYFGSILSISSQTCSTCKGFRMASFSPNSLYVERIIGTPLCKLNAKTSRQSAPRRARFFRISKRAHRRPKLSFRHSCDHVYCLSGPGTGNIEA